MKDRDIDKEGKIPGEGQRTHHGKCKQFLNVMEDNGLLACWVCCAKLTARAKMWRKKNAVLEWLREMIKGGVIYEITVGHSEIDEEDEGKEDKKKYSKWKKGRN